MTNYTPEKWAAYSLKDTTGQWFVESEDEEICCLMGVNAKEHAQLIAAAPELLEALRKAERFLTIEFEHYQRKLRNATPDEEHLFQNAYDNFKAIVESITPAIAKAEEHA